MPQIKKTKKQKSKKTIFFAPLIKACPPNWRGVRGIFNNFKFIILNFKFLKKNLKNFFWIPVFTGMTKKGVLKCLKIKSLIYCLKIRNWKLEIKKFNFRNYLNHPQYPKNLKSLIKRYSHPLIASILLIVLVTSFLFIKTKVPSIFGATYYFIQSSWSGGASTTALAIHPTDSTGWTKYQSASSSIIAGANSITASTTSGNWPDNFSGGAPDSNTYVLGGLVNLKKNNGVTCSADQQCTAGNCDADFSSGNYCHATATSCVDYAGGTPWELVNSYNKCINSSSYKICSNSVWGGQTSCTATGYCNAGGGAQSGWGVNTCTVNGLSNPCQGAPSSCNSCSPYITTSTSSCDKSSCSSDSDCWSGFNCVGSVCLPACSASTACGTQCAYGGLTYNSVTANSKCWMDRNLGATAVATAYNSPTTSYGDYYQWGRKTNGHQVYNSSISTTQFSTYDQDPISGGLFIKGFGDWLSSQNDNLWGAAGGYLNNPCPTGWHVPGTTEWTSVVSALTITNYTNAATSVLHLPASGDRYYSDASFEQQGMLGYYWSNVPNFSFAYRSDALYLSSSDAYTSIFVRAYGFSVRCVKN